MSPETAHVRVSHLTKKFGGVTAVDDVSFEVPKGSSATLLGPSGCAKTTTLRMIAGFYDPDHGDIEIAGKRVNNLPVHRRGTAMVFQDYALFPHMTVRDNVAYGLKVAHVSGADRTRRVDETLAFVGLGGVADRWTNQLSGGRRQGVAGARAFVIQPQVLLLDEPLSNLDAKLREQLRVEMRILQRRLGMTFVYVTHDQEEALSLSDWIAVMRAGKVEQAGAPWEIYYHPRTAFLADFVGAVNLVPARVTDLADGTATVSFGRNRAEVRRPEAAPSIGQDVQLSVRPGRFGTSISRSGTASSARSSAPRAAASRRRSPWSPGSSHRAGATCWSAAHRCGASGVMSATSSRSTRSSRGRACSTTSRRVRAFAASRSGRPRSVPGIGSSGSASPGSSATTRISSPAARATVPRWRRRSATIP